jgi:hypothetical protein
MYISQAFQSHINPLRTEGILRKLQKVMKLAQKWKDVEKIGTT